MTILLHFHHSQLPVFRWVFSYAAYAGWHTANGNCLERLLVPHRDNPPGRRTAAAQETRATEPGVCCGRRGKTVAEKHLFQSRGGGRHMTVVTNVDGMTVEGGGRHAETWPHCAKVKVQVENKWVSR